MASSLSLVPRESSKIEDSLKALGTNFSLDPVVVDAFIRQVSLILRSFDFSLTVRARLSHGSRSCRLGMARCSRSPA